MLEILIQIFIYFTAQFGADYLNDKIKEDKQDKSKQEKLIDKQN
jgi:hypothetical protein